MRRVAEFKDTYSPKPKGGFATVERTYRLISPLFGGGAEPKYADMVSAVRATSLKGQLRFWWRAARAGGMSLEQMREKEAKIVGSSRVDLQACKLEYSIVSPK